MIVKSRKYWRRRERGQIYVLMSLGIVALLGMAGLAADIGVIYGTRRQMQTAADAAAIAAANALQGSSSVAAGYQTAANDAASINGFTNSTNGVTITTTEVSCPGAASEQCVQVNIAQAVPTYFLRALGKSSISLDTVAIAGGVNAPGCIYALDPSASEAVSFTGNVNITASCGLIDDSSNSQGLYATGNGTIQTTSAGVAGNYNSASLGNMHFTPTPITGIAPAPDPLASLSQPSVPTCSQAATTHSGTETVSGNNATVNLSPGIYSSGISIGGNVGTLNFLAGNFGNGISFNGNLTTANFAAGQYQNGGGSGAAVTLSGNFGANFASGVSFCGPLKLSRQQRSDASAGSVLRRNLDHGKLQRDIRTGHLHPGRRRLVGNRQFDSERDGGDLLRHDRAGWLWPNQLDGQRDRQLERAHLGSAQGDVVFPG